MNIVQDVLDQLSPDVLGKLSSSLGGSQADTTKAVTAGVPSLFALLAKLAASAGGLEKLLELLKNFDPGLAGKTLDHINKGGATPHTEQGTDILGSLLGGGTLSAVIGLLAKFSGLGATVAKKLLSMLGPLVLGAIVNGLKNKGGISAQGLSSLFAEQKSNIDHAMPAGFSLANLEMPEEKAPGLPGWLLPLIGLAAVGVIGYFLFGQPAEKPPVVEVPAAQDAPPKIDAGAVPKLEVAPEITKFTDDLTGLYTSATETLTGITDGPTADAAEPKLKGFLGSVDSLKPIFDKLPESAKAAIAAVQAKYLAPLKELIAKVEALPVIGDKLKPTLDDLSAKLSAFGG